MCFWYISEIIILSSFLGLELSHFSSSSSIDSGYHIQCPPIVVDFCMFFFFFFVMVWRFACAFGIFLKLWLLFLRFELNQFSSSNSINSGYFFGRNFSYNYGQFFLNLISRYCCHNLKICISFCYIPGIILSFFLQLWTVPFWNFAGVLITVWKFACAFGIFLKVFLSLFVGFELSHVSSSNSIDSGYFVDATPPTDMDGSFWNFASVFVMVWS